MKNRENAALIVGVTFCVIFGADRLYRFYYQNIPLARPGECLEIDRLFSRTVVMVLENDKQKSVIIKDSGEVVSMRYEDLRDRNAKKVSCE